MNHPAAPPPAAPERRTAGLPRLIGVVVAVFILTFSLVPLYRLACEKVFGIRLDNRPSQSQLSAAPAASARLVTVEFDGAVNSRLPWAFQPQVQRMQVTPGQLYDAQFLARNEGKRAIVGNAVPSVAPARASQYFIKTECFCFTAQTLDPGESRQMPVRFMLDPDLPADVSTVTLSYTFFKNEALTARLNGSAGNSTARSAP
jgi:cytochrome c oxidase assembly protein subunit 11